MSKEKSARYKQIKKHFEEEAVKYDRVIREVAPNYDSNVEALVSAVTFNTRRKIRVLDIGCGTGNITEALVKRYPNASVVCLDITESMLSTAKAKLRKYKRIEFERLDARDIAYCKEFDVVISSLALHHVTEKEKPRLYGKIYAALKRGGVFYNADIVKASNNTTYKMYLNKWREFMHKNLSPARIAETLRNHEQEDRPSPLMSELKMIGEAGFTDVDVIWKNYYFAVYGGRK